MNLYNSIEKKLEKDFQECLDIRNRMEAYFYKRNNRTNITFSELKVFIEKEAETSEIITRDLEIIKHSRWWKY